MDLATALCSLLSVYPVCLEDKEKVENMVAHCLRGFLSGCEVIKPSLISWLEEEDLQAVQRDRFQELEMQDTLREQTFNVVQMIYSTDWQHNQTALLSHSTMRLTISLLWDLSFCVLYSVETETLLEFNHNEHG